MTAEISEPSLEFHRNRIVERPDGFYWQSADGDREHGPFATLQEAIEDMTSSDAEIGVEETLEEAESELGIADWIDPATGELAEESVPRIEDR